MAYTNILEGCVHSIGGVKEFKIATRLVNGNPIRFPLNINFVAGSSDTVVFTEDVYNRTITIGDDVIEYRNVYPKLCTYVEEEVEQRQGIYYEKTLTWEMPKVNPTTQNQLNEFLFTTDGDFGISSAIVFFTDSNNQNWFGSIDIPFILQNYDTTTDTRGGDNKYVLSYRSNSYLRTLKYITQ